MEKTVIGGITASSIDMDAAKAKGKDHWEHEYEKLGNYRSHFISHWLQFYKDDPDALAFAELRFSSLMNDFRKWIDETFKS